MLLGQHGIHGSSSPQFFGYIAGDAIDAVSVDAAFLTHLNDLVSTEKCSGASLACIPF